MWVCVCFLYISTLIIDVPQAQHINWHGFHPLAWFSFTSFFPFSFGGGWWVDVDVRNAEGPDWLGFLVFLCAANNMGTETRTRTSFTSYKSSPKSLKRQYVIFFKQPSAAWERNCNCHSENPTSVHIYSTTSPAPLFHEVFCFVLKWELNFRLTKDAKSHDQMTCCNVNQYMRLFIANYYSVLWLAIISREVASRYRA